jgi:transcriptional regulator with XRE-family HTH domain
MIFIMMLTSLFVSVNLGWCDSQRIEQVVAEWRQIVPDRLMRAHQVMNLRLPRDNQLSDADLAKAISISRSTVSGIMNGHLLLSVELATEFARVLQVDRSYLLAFDFLLSKLAPNGPILFEEISGTKFTLFKKAMREAKRAGPSPDLSHTLCRELLIIVEEMKHRPFI